LKEKKEGGGRDRGVGIYREGKREVEKEMERGRED